MAKNRYKQRKVKSRKIDEHRLVMERHLGRRLKTEEFVHHINDDKYDNNLENLQIVDPVTHGRMHHLVYPITKSCVICGTIFTPHKTKRKRKQTCSEKCKLALIRWKRWGVVPQCAEKAIRELGALFE